MRLPRLLLLFALAGFPLPSFVLAETPEAAATPSGSVWDLTDLYPSVEAWEASREAVRAKLPQLTAFEGTLDGDAKDFQRFLDLKTEVDKESIRLLVYATLAADVDLRNSDAVERKDLSYSLLSDIEAATSFLAPELLKIGAEKIRSYFTENPELSDYRFPVEEILRGADHVLGAEAEAVLANASKATEGSRNVHALLSNADIPWPTITLKDGSEVVVDQSGYRKLRAEKDRDDRKAVFDAFWGTYKTYENTFGAIYAEKINSDVFYAKTRNYPSSLHRALDAANIPTKVYTTLLEEVNTTLPTLHRYFRLRARMLGVEQACYYDIYPDLVYSDREYPLEEGKRILLECIKPLGPDYMEKAETAIHSPWLHAYPSPGKRSGAYMFGDAYDVHPYILMNYQGDYDSVSTLAHEWGHGLHTMLAIEAQPYTTYDYATFTAEIASVVNEVLLLEYMLANTSSDQEKLFFLGSALEQMRGTFFRQAMFAEFELRAHEIVENGGAISGKRMTELYGEILKHYHGHDEGILLIDDLYTLEWAYIPHFYRDFYVFQYATSMAAANLLADRILSGDPSEVETYLNFLRAGGSDHPYDLVKRAGVDLASPDPYRSTVARMNSIMDQMEAILAKNEK